MLENDKFSRTKCRGIIVKRGARLEKRNTGIQSLNTIIRVSLVKA